MNIALDVMGADYSPNEIIEGALLARDAISEIETIFLVGRQEEIVECLKNRCTDKLSIVNADEIITMNEHPAEAYRKKKDASITVATKLVKEKKADFIISAGSTGAQLASGLFELGRIKGVKRPAIGVFLPTENGDKLLLDAGANTNVNELILHQFALMGSIYYEIKTKKEAKVGLINNGSEENKGSDLTQKTWQILNSDKNLKFIGNMEGKDISTGKADVYVCDGFTGNIILKTMEGLGKSIFSEIKNRIKTSFRYKIGALLLRPLFKELGNKMNPNRVGGAPLLGINGISIVCHGSSKRDAILSAFYTGIECYNANLVETIQAHMVTKELEDGTE